jgi:hypothetical protein
MTLNRLLTFFRRPPELAEAGHGDVLATFCVQPDRRRQEPTLRVVRTEPPPPLDTARWVERSEVAAAIDRAIKAAEASPLWTNNERRSARCVALYLQQQLTLPITYFP